MFPKSILVIEDNPDIRENTTEMLELAGYQVIVAPDSQEALTLAREKKPHIILCDVVMPGLNGYEVFTQLKKDTLTAAIPFIFVSASVEKKEIKAAMDMGVDGYIRKPFELTELLNAISQILDRD